MTQYLSRGFSTEYKASQGYSTLLDTISTLKYQFNAGLITARDFETRLMLEVLTSEEI